MGAGPGARYGRSLVVGGSELAKLLAAGSSVEGEPSGGLAGTPACFAAFRRRFDSRFSSAFCLLLLSRFIFSNVFWGFAKSCLPLLEVSQTT